MEGQPRKIKGPDGKKKKKLIYDPSWGERAKKVQPVSGIKGHRVRLKNLVAKTRQRGSRGASVKLKV